VDLALLLFFSHNFPWQAVFRIRKDFHNFVLDPEPDELQHSTQKWIRIRSITVDYLDLFHDFLKFLTNSASGDI
jgi:hypothetical protein